MSNVVIDPFSLEVSSSFLPTDIANLGAWWKFDRGVTEVSNAISQIDDQSVNGLDLIQDATDAERPTLNTGGANGQPYAQFDGGDWLFNTSMSTVNTTDITVFFVGKLDLVTTRSGLIFRTSGAALLERLRTNSASGGQYQRTGTISGDLAVTRDIEVTAAVITRAPQGGTQDVLDDLANEATDTATSPGTLAIGQISLGSNVATAASSAWDGRIYEVGFYTAAISNADRTSLMDYLKSEYGL